jgi:hypothetical protein
MTTTASALPALPSNADVRSITERVNALIRAYNGAVAPPVDLTNAINFPPTVSAADLTVYMASNTIIGIGTVNLCNTGSIGAAGQKWEITGVGLIGDANSTQTVVGVSIHDGTSVVANGGGVMGWGVSNWPVTSICRAVVTLGGPTIFTLRGSGNDVWCVAYSQGYGGALNTATFISARRIS